MHIRVQVLPEVGDEVKMVNSRLVNGIKGIEALFIGEEGTSVEIVVEKSDRCLFFYHTHLCMSLLGACVYMCTCVCVCCLGVCLWVVCLGLCLCLFVVSARTNKRHHHLYLHLFLHILTRMFIYTHTFTHTNTRNTHTHMNCTHLHTTHTALAFSLVTSRGVH